MELTGNHLKAARALVGIDQDRLAELSGVSINTVRNMEACGDRPIGGYVRTREQVQSALEALGIEFTNGTSPGVRLARRGRGSAGTQDRPAGSRSAEGSKSPRRSSTGRRKPGG